MKNKFQERKEKFEKIEAYYRRHSEKIGPVRATKYGVWGPSKCSIIFGLFNRIGLEKYSNFIDLGSGDGRVALIASLFTDSTGMETDKKLMNFAKRGRNELDLPVKLMTKDYFKEDLKRYESLFIYPDKKEYPKLQKKLTSELEGRVFVYKIYKPRYLKKIKDHIFEGITITEFEKGDKIG